MYRQRRTAARGIPVLWLSCAIVMARRWSLKAFTTASPRASEVMKLGSVNASISSAMVKGRGGGLSACAPSDCSESEVAGAGWEKALEMFCMVESLKKVACKWAMCLRVRRRLFGQIIESRHSITVTEFDILLTIPCSGVASFHFLSREFHRFVV